jgi:hypothetical protein
MPTYRDLFELNIKYMDYLIAKTSLSHGYLKNIQVTGTEIEYEVRDLLRNLLPRRFHVTHGYIVSAKNTDDEPAVSPQVDVIIVDTLVPHSLFMVDQQSGMEIVPVEAVVGIFEVKRTLDKDSLLGSKKEKGAIKQLNDVCECVEIHKDNQGRYLPGGILAPIIGSETYNPDDYNPPAAYPGLYLEIYHSAYHSNPIVGIIGVDHAKNTDSVFRKKNKKSDEGDLGMIDIIFSLRGYMLSIVDAENHAPLLLTARTNDGKKLLYGSPDPSASHPAYALGYVLWYLNLVCGRKFDPNNYFYNKSLFKDS